MKFQTIHLFAFVTGFAGVFAFVQWSLMGATIVSVMILGPTIAHATSPTLSSLLAGFLSAIFWTIVAILFTSPLFVRDDLLGWETYSKWLVTIPVLSSIVGGYVGARVAMH